MDGQAVEIDQLDKIFQTAKENNIGVHYYREGRASPPQSMEVMKLVVKHKVPISMSTKPDFSDVVDPKVLKYALRKFESSQRAERRFKPNLKHSCRVGVIGKV